MNWTGAVRTILVCAILIVLHYTLRPLLAWRASIDFMIVALLLGAVRMRPGAAAVYGFVLGLIADSLGVTVFGAAALGMSIVGFAASWLKAVFFADNLALNGFFLFVAKWVFDLIFLLMGAMSGGGSSDLVMQIFVWSPLAAAVTAVAGVLVLSVLKPLMEVRTP
jgi:rod shape-determining protein MreD